MYKLNKIRGFAALPLIIGGAIIAAGLIGGAVYELNKNNSLSTVDKNNLLAQVASNPTGVLTNDPLTCHTYWYFHDSDSNPICQQGQFCGAYMSQGLRTFGTQATCQAALPHINRPSIKVISPNGGENFTVGDTMHITWNTSSDWTDSLCEIDLRTSNVANSSDVAKYITGYNNTNLVDCKSGHYDWVVSSDIPADNYWIDIIGNEKGGGDDNFNNGSFSISNADVSNVTTCTSFTYSDWSACSSSGQQTRTITSSGPTGCTGGNPIITQSCNYSVNQPAATADSGLTSNQVSQILLLLRAFQVDEATIAKVQASLTGIVPASSAN